MKRSLTIATTLAAAVLSTAAQADSIQLHGKSIHYIEGDYREINPGISYLYESTDFIATAGIVQNSVYNTTAYGLYGKQHQFGNLKLRHGYGLATGYLDQPIPMIAFQANYHYINVTTIPGALLFSLELPLND